MPVHRKINIRRLNLSYLFALGIIAVLSVAVFFLLLGILRTNEHIAAVINASGRQRMLSQRIALYGLQLVESKTEAEQQQNRKELLNAVDTMETSHELLHVTGGVFEGQTLPAPSPEVLSIYFGPRGQLDAEIKSYFTEARELAAAPGEQLSADNPHLKALLDAADQRIPAGLDQVVDQHQMESDATLNRLEYLLIASVSIILLALVMEGFFIFRPMVRRIRGETRQLEEAYEQQARIAEALQKNLISGEIPDMEGLEVGLFYRSATETAEVGGDFYDFVNLPGGGWGIVLGDVAGKGVDAAVEPVKVRELINDRANRGLAPGEMLTSVNNSLARQYEESFIAVTYASYYPGECVLRLANAGNPYPFLMRAQRLVDLSEPPLGAVAAHKYSELKVEFEPGETILLYTDGLAQAPAGDRYYGQGLERRVAGKESMGLKELVRELVNEATRLAGGRLTDDILVMAVRRRL
jgi:hypothetical protein